MNIVHFSASLGQLSNTEKNKNYRRLTGSGDSRLCRTPVLYPVLAKELEDMFEKQHTPIPIVIDGDADGKSGLSLRLAQLNRLGKDNNLRSSQARAAFLGILAQKFPIFRRDIRESSLDKYGQVMLVPDDTTLLKTSDLLDVAKTSISSELESIPPEGRCFELEPAMRASLGQCEKGDATEMPFQVLSPSVRITENIWHKIHPDVRAQYAQSISQSQAPGSLVVLGGGERQPKVNAKCLLGNAYKPAGGNFKKMSLFYKREYTPGGPFVNNEELPYRARTVSDGKYSIRSVDLAQYSPSVVKKS